MDVKKYEAFQKVVELGSFSKAAEALGYTQSAVSQIVASLEDELSMKLVERSKLGAKLTIEGRELFPYIERVVNQQRALREKADEINGLETGVVRIGSLTCISGCWLPGLIRSFEKRYPNVQFVINQGDYTTVAEWVREGAVDFAFANPAAVEGLKSLPIKEGPMLAVLPQGHPLTEYDVVPLAELARERYILLEEGNFYEPLEAFAAAGTKPQVRYAIHDAYAIMAMVEEGLGVSILAEMILSRTNHRIVLRPTEPAVTRPIGAIFRDWDALPVASRRFIEHVQGHAEELL